MKILLITFFLLVFQSPVHANPLPHQEEENYREFLQSFLQQMPDRAIPRSTQGPLTVQAISQNHVRLLQAVNEAKAFLEKPDNSAVTKNVMRRWIIALHRDAVLNRAMGQENDFQETRPDLQASLDQTGSVDASDLSQPNPLLSEDYLTLVRQLMNQFNQTQDNELDDRTARSFSRRFLNLIDSRKDLSDRYYMTMMKDTFLDDAFTLEKKIDYFSNFIGARDWSLVDYGSGYFEALLEEETLTPEQQRQIESLLNSIPAGEQK